MDIIFVHDILSAYFFQEWKYLFSFYAKWKDHYAHQFKLE